MDTVLVVNAGSSSLKYALVAPESGDRLADGLVERIGEETSRIWHGASGTHPEVEIEHRVADHRQAFNAVQFRLDEVTDEVPSAIGHRVVHGGDRFSSPVLIDEVVIEAIEACVPLAPLHNPACLLGIHSARAEFPAVPQVAVFDTAFHAGMPATAARYALEAGIAAARRIRRYGFHGTSHQYVSERGARYLGIPIGSFNAVTLHLGNGASACAVRGGRSVDTSMGVTPLEGLIMGTRTGDLDPSVPVMLFRAGMSADEVDDLMNRRSGLKGLCGVNDMREVHAMAEAGDEAADLARHMTAHRLRKYLGGYMYILGRVDAVIFTAGMGENDAWLRARTCADAASFGIVLDDDANAGSGGGVRMISTGTVPVLVVPTDEEHAIAELSLAALGDA